MASRVPHDIFYRPATEFFVANHDEVVLWSPWHRVEVFNTIRQLAQNPDAKQAVRQANGRAIIIRLENDVRCDYLTHIEADWRDVLRTANEISAAHAYDLHCRAADLLHVAYAVELSAELFVSFDDDQLAIAKAAGLKTENPAA